HQQAPVRGQIVSWLLQQRQRGKAARAIWQQYALFGLVIYRSSSWNHHFCFFRFTIIYYNLAQRDLQEGKDGMQKSSQFDLHGVLSKYWLKI
ncbi:MAG: hypothetical protein CW335_08175, partial [Clostridiales bacterium]|nr:hypothetical protein [Clostridiales bacterium]